MFYQLSFLALQKSSDFQTTTFFRRVLRPHVISAQGTGSYVRFSRAKLRGDDISPWMILGDELKAWDFLYYSDSMLTVFFSDSATKENNCVSNSIGQSQRIFGSNSWIHHPFDERRTAESLNHWWLVGTESSWQKKRPSENATKKWRFLDIFLSHQTK